MASQQKKHERRAQAVERLTTAKSRVAELLGFEVQEVAATRLDPELAQIQQTEDVAGFLEKVVEEIEAERATDAEEAEEKAKADDESGGENADDESEVPVAQAKKARRKRAAASE